MAWLEVHQTVVNHRKTLHVADVTGEEVVHIVGHMVSLWLWIIDNAPDGNLNKVTHKSVARAAQFEGAPEVFWTALIEAGFVDVTDDGPVVHDWWDFAGKLLLQREHASEQKRRHNQLYNDKGLVSAIRRRDKDHCRYCGRAVNWRDRKGVDGATYDYVDPEGPTVLENIVVACRACNAGKGQRTPAQAGYALLPVQISIDSGQISSPDLAAIKPSSTQTVQYSTLENTRKEKNQEELIHTPDFVDFWATYPRPIEKRNAEKCWKKLLSEGYKPEDLLSATRNYATACKGSAFAKYPATFLGPSKPFEEFITGIPVGFNAKTQTIHDLNKQFLESELRGDKDGDPR